MILALVLCFSIVCVAFAEPAEAVEETETSESADETEYADPEAFLDAVRTGID